MIPHLHSDPVRIACWGNNGHQVDGALRDCPYARLVAVGGMPRPAWAEGIPHFDRLDRLLESGTAELVVLCSPRRADQAADAMLCLAAGRHVLAEKPCALDEAELERLISAAGASGLVFHEMAGTAFIHPWLALRRLIDSGRLGQVIQITAQKSYPMHAGRPHDEAVDGGIIRQCAVHALRFLEHGCGQRIRGVQAWHSTVASPAPSGLVTSAGLLVELDGGAVATVCANYANPPGFGQWGDDQLRLWGSGGMVEITRGATQSRVVLGDQDLGPLVREDTDFDWLHAVCAQIRGWDGFPITLADELSPTRWALRARVGARTVTTATLQR